MLPKRIKHLEMMVAHLEPLPNFGHCILRGTFANYSNQFKIDQNNVGSGVEDLK